MSVAAAHEPASSLPVVAIVGATGTGKSETALDLVESLRDQKIPAVILNADAMQLYRGMDIGTAKLPLDERREIDHHLLDVWEVTREASVADYQGMARAMISQCVQRGIMPILVGGSGLYVSSVLYEFEFPGTDKAVRAELEARLDTEGVDALLQELRERDPLAFAAIDPHNHRRVVRALEVITLTGKPFGAGLDAERRPWRDNTLIVGVQSERDELVPRLDDRVLGMWSNGLVDEVESLIPLGIERGVTASRAIGYQQALSYLAGTLSKEEAIAETQALTRRYARRQVSWFGRDPHIRWHQSGNPRRVAQMVSSISKRLA